MAHPRQAHAKLRPRIEAKFDEQMNRHGLQHARYWGLGKVALQVLLASFRCAVSGSFSRRFRSAVRLSTTFRR